MPAFATDANSSAQPVHTAQHPAARKAIPRNIRLRKLSPIADSTPPEKYPAIDAMEKRSFGHAFPNDALDIRLSRLEFRHYQKTYTDLSLNERTDRLRNICGDKTLEGELYKERPVPPEALPREGGVPVSEGTTSTGDVLPNIIDVPLGLYDPPLQKTMADPPDVPKPSLTSQLKPLAVKLARRAARQAVRRAATQFMPANVAMGLRYAGLAGNVAAILIMAAKSSPAFNKP